MAVLLEHWKQKKSIADCVQLLMFFIHAYAINHCTVPLRASDINFTTSFQAQSALQLRSELANIHNSNLHPVLAIGRRQLTTSHNKQLLLILQHAQVPGVSRLLRRRNRNPVASTQTLVNENISAAGGRNDNSTVLAANRAPLDVRRAKRNNTIGSDDGKTDSGAELLGRRRDLVVYGELVRGVAAVGSAAVLVRHDVLSVRQQGDGRHARAVSVGRVLDVVDNRAPFLEVGGGLVHHLLAVLGVALVGVVADQLVLVEHKERLPDGGQAVVGAGLAAGGDVRDELPGLAAVGAGVELDLRHGEVGGDGAAGEEDGAGFVACEVLGQDVEEGLVAETPSIDGVLDSRALFPGVAAIFGVVDGEVDLGWLRSVVLPCCDEGAVFQLCGASV